MPVIRGAIGQRMRDVVMDIQLTLHVLDDDPRARSIGNREMDRSTSLGRHRRRPNSNFRQSFLNGRKVPQDPVSNI